MMMRVFCFLLLILGPLLVHAVQEMAPSELVVIDGITYVKGSENRVPFNGMMVSYFENGQKESQITYRDGLRHGKDAAWYPGGQLRHVVRYKVGIIQSDGSSWYARNGGKKSLNTFMSCSKLDGIEVICGKAEEGPSAYFESDAVDVILVRMEEGPSAHFESDAIDVILVRAEEGPSAHLEYCQNGSC